MEHNTINNEDDIELENVAKIEIENLPVKSVFLDNDDNKTICIDRAEEDESVDKFQKTGDMRLLEKIYNNRIPTLKSWANKHYYPGLTPSIEDLFEELSLVFVKAAHKYNKKRGAFNTCLFTFLLNRIKNLKSSMYAKKRLSEEYDGPLSGMILSLDYSYNEKDGSDVTLKDVIPSVVNNEVQDTDDVINMLSGGDHIVKDFLGKVSNGESVSNLLKEAKVKTGVISLSGQEEKKAKRSKENGFIKELIQNKIKEKDFSLVDYKIDGGKLTYRAKFKKTNEFETLSRAMRFFRKNKQVFISKLRT